MGLEILLYLLAIPDLDNAECQAQFADVGKICSSSSGTASGTMTIRFISPGLSSDFNRSGYGSTKVQCIDPLKYRSFVSIVRQDENPEPISTTRRGFRWRIIE